MTTSKVIILGGSGYLGSQFEGVLKAGRSEVNLLCRSETLNFLKKIQPKIIILSAPGGVFTSQRKSKKHQYFIDEVRIQINVVESAIACGIEKLYVISSIAALPIDKELPDEEDVLRGTPDRKVIEYAYAKRTLEVLLQSVRRDFGFSYSSLLVSNVYGPGRNYTSHPSLIPHLLRSCIKAKINKERWLISGNSKSTRDYIYAKDISKIVNQLTVSATHFDRLIIASGQQKKVGEIVELIADKLNFKGQILWDSFDTKADTKVCNNNRLLSTLPKLQFTPFKDGIHQTIQWFLSHYDPENDTSKVS